MAATFTDNSSNITTAVSSTAVSSLAVNVPTDRVDGDVMHLFAVGDGSGGFNLPSGWIEVVRTTNSTMSGMVAKRIVAGEPSSYTVNFTSGSDEMALVIMLVKGAPDSSPIDVESSSSQTFAVASDNTEGIEGAEGVTTGDDDELCIEYVLINDDDDDGNEHVPGHASAVSTGFTNGYLPSGDGSGQCMMGLSTFVQATAGATPTPTSTEAEQWLIDGGAQNAGIENCIKGTIAIKTAGAPGGIAVLRRRREGA